MAAVLVMVMGLWGWVGSLVVLFFRYTRTHAIFDTHKYTQTHTHTQDKRPVSTQKQKKIHFEKGTIVRGPGSVLRYGERMARMQ